MHARFQELLSFRDGEPVSVDVAAHLAECRGCSLELARLERLRGNLRHLPLLDAPPAWLAIRERLQQPPRFRLNAAWISAAGAAAVVIVIVSLWIGRTPPDTAQEIASSHPLGENTAIEPLVQRSQELEELLQVLPSRPSVERAATSAAIDGLQVSIQVLDARLATAGESGLDQNQTERLWSERVQLLDSLVNVRYAEAARRGFWLTTGAL